MKIFLPVGTICYLKSDFDEVCPLMVESSDKEAASAVVYYKTNSGLRRLTLPVAMLLYGSKKRKKELLTQDNRMRKPAGALRTGDVGFIKSKMEPVTIEVINYQNNTITVRKKNKYQNIIARATISITDFEFLILNDNRRTFNRWSFIYKSK